MTDSTESHLPLVSDQVEGHLFAVTPEGRLLYLSPGGDEALGGDGALCRVRSSTHPDRMSPFGSALAESVGSGTDLECVLPDGGRRVLEPRGEWLDLDLNGGQRVGLGVLLDVTRRRNAASEPDAAPRGSARAGSPAPAERAEILRIIHAKNLEAVGRLAAGVSHEVKNPLTVILMGVEYLRRVVPTGDEDAAAVLQDMDDAVKRANEVVRGLLELAATRELVFESTAPNAVVEKALAVMRHECSRAHVEVVADLHPTLPRVCIDRARIKQVLVQLMLNAVQAMEAGGCMRVQTRADRLGDLRSSGAASDDGETVVAVIVEDEGPGISPADLGRVFDPFFTGKVGGKGSGLGLTVVQQIIGLHDGWVWVENLERGGLRATVALRPEQDDGGETARSSG